MKEYIIKDSPGAMLVGIKIEKELVRCKDCKHRINGCCYIKKSDRIHFGVYVADEWFCADGERRSKE